MRNRKNISLSGGIEFVQKLPLLKQSHVRRCATAAAAALFACAIAFLLIATCLFVGAPYAHAAETDQQSDSSQNASTSDNLIIPEDSSTPSGVLEISIAELEQADTYLNGQYVQIVGEVVGDRIYAETGPENCWLTIEARDGSDAEVVAFIATDATDVIDTYGSYGKTGTIVQLQGDFNLACDEHEGLSDLHVENIAVVAEGSQQADEFNINNFIPAVILIVVGVLLILIFARLRRSRR